MSLATTRARLLASTIITGISLAGFGVSHAANAAADTAVQELVVTGSRIPQPNLTSVSPLTTVTSAEIKLQGTTNIETLLNDLPSAFAGQTSQVSNGASGTATADLRNLGNTRTLVLVDGKRLPAGDPTVVSPDLNFIPAALVDRVDVVTGGASAVYGSDAVAGVVNFIMKKNFEGVQVDYQYSFDNHQQGNTVGQSALRRKGLTIPSDIGGDGAIHDVSVILGSNLPDGRGNVTAYLSYRHLDPILQASRDFAGCGLIEGATSLDCFGSSNSAYGRFDSANGHARFANNPDGTKTFVPYKGAFGYNFNPLNFMQREDERYAAGFFAHYKVSNAVEVYTNFMFMDDQTNAQIAPSGLFGNEGPNLTAGYMLNCNNPLMSGVQAMALGCVGRVSGAPGGQVIGDGTGTTPDLQSIRYRFASVPRNDDLNHTDYKMEVGSRGDIGSGWSYDASLSIGVSRLTDRTSGYGSLNKIQNALLAYNDPATGKLRCVSSDPSCVPLNVFQSLGVGITPAQYNYVLVDSLTIGETTQQVASFNLTGDLGHYGIKSPFANDGVGLNIGAEYRRDTLKELFDFEKQTGDLSGSGAQSLDVNGATNVKEVYTELRVPLAHDLPLIKDLTFDGGYRFSHFNLAGDTNTYKFGLEYRPIEDLLLRASYNHAVRAPNVQDLYAPTVAVNGSFQDPCGVPDTGGAPPASLAQCRNTAKSDPNFAAHYGIVSACPAAQCEVLQGGGAAQGLKAEDADTYTVGFVYQPSFLHGFVLSADYFDIKVHSVIEAGIAPPPSIIAACLADATSPLCGLIHRDPTNGSLGDAQGYVVQTSANAGLIATDGVDVSASYRFTLPDWFHGSSAGSVALSLIGTYTDHLKQQPYAGGPIFDCAGFIGNQCSTNFGSPSTPHWKHEARVTWNTPWKLTASLNWRYIGPTKLDLLSSDSFLNGGSTTNTIEPGAHAYSYFDLSFQYKLTQSVTVRAGVNNLFDIDPPVFDSVGLPVSGPPYGNANTFPGVYDSLGRNIFVGLTANF